MELFDNTFFECIHNVLTIKFYIDNNELKIVLTRLTFFKSVDIEIKSSNFHVIKHLSSNEPVKLKYCFDGKNQLEFISNFMKNLYINIVKPKEIVVDKMIIYHDSNHTNGAEKLLEYCNLNNYIEFKLKKVYANQIVL
jgi:hypothetical protein